MNLVGDSDPNQINATESEIQSGTQTLVPYRSREGKGKAHPFYALHLFLLPSLKVGSREWGTRGPHGVRLPVGWALLQKLRFASQNLTGSAHLSPSWKRSVQQIVQP